MDEKELEAMAAPIPDNSPKRVRARKVVPTDEKVWVKIVSQDKPWSGDRPLEYWCDYQIDLNDALILSERKQAVILKQPE